MLNPWQRHVNCGKNATNTQWDDHVCATAAAVHAYNTGVLFYNSNRNLCVLLQQPNCGQTATYVSVERNKIWKGGWVNDYASFALY